MISVIRLSVAILLSLSLSLTSFAQSKTPQAGAPQAKAAGYLEEQWRLSGAPAVSVAIAQHGGLVFSKGIGFADLDNSFPATGSTVYNIGSISKVITVVAIMKLLEEGKIALDDPIRKYVPQFPDKGSPITIRQILTHTSGIRHYRPKDFPDSADGENLKPFHSFDEAINIFKNDPLLFKPGQYYFYSSYAVNLLQGVIEKTTQMSFEDYLRKNVWIPAGMMSTTVDVPERIVPNRAKGYLQDKGRTLNNPYGDLTYKFASGGMLSTVEDLVRFAEALNHGTLLKPETTSQMYRPQLKEVLRYQEKGPPTREDFEQGLIWRMQKDKSGRTFVYHCGTVKGFNACLVNYVEEDLIVAIACNEEAIGFRPALEFAEFFRLAR
ncbi:MAG: beta-lactamase family protein [Acidobacteriota bacterium]|nr:beta-lactamase family protein [Acidobacteriota bacterium]